MVTSEPVRDRMVAFTRAISAAASAMSRSIDASDGLSKGTTTATSSLQVRPTGHILGYNHRTSADVRIGALARQGQAATTTRQVAVIKEKAGCGNWFGRMTLCWFQRLARCSTARISII